MRSRPGDGTIVLLSIVVAACWLVSLPRQVEACSVDWENPNKCYPMVYHITGAHCFNNGSGICKAFSGRFEFYYDTFRDKFIGPAPKSEFVDEFGYHQRVPVSYNITGHINYVDRSINWARVWSAKEGKRLSLLSSTSFNWCRLAVNNWWPYKSAVLDPTRRYHIFFYNRQSCIYDSQNPDTENAYQHFNTRFLHNSTLRIDLDMNPTIFTMEDQLAQQEKIRLIKHHRQHWYEVEFRVLVKPSPELNYFVYMSSTQTLPCKIDGTKGSFIPASAFDEYKNGRCIDDTIHLTRNGKNSPLFEMHCGTEQTEVVDLPAPLHNVKGGSIILESDIHNLSKRPPVTTELFYGLNIEYDSYWEEFARDGFVFSATTTIPIDESTVRVIMLFADFKQSTPQTLSDEHYPLPMIADYQSRIILNKDSPEDSKWEYDRASNAKAVKTLNYVDDIAYLHSCQTILVILGPLYSELPVESFTDLSVNAPVDSIYSLSIFELANSFFAMPDSNTLWVFHRTNYMTDHVYTCNSGRDGLVTASKGSGKYYPRIGANQPPFLRIFFDKMTTDHYEESVFKDLGVFKGSHSSPEAPDPANYPLGNQDVGDPVKPKDNTWIFILLGVCIIIILAMCVICMFAMRARRRRRTRGHLDASPTLRSSFLDSILHPFSAMPTQRSSLQSRLSGSKMDSRLTDRTSLQRSSQLGSSVPSSGVTRRSTMTQGPSSRSSTGPRGSSDTRRSGISAIASSGKNRSKHAPRSSSRVSSSPSVSSRPRSRSVSSNIKAGRSGRSHSSTRPITGHASSRTK